MPSASGRGRLATLVAAACLLTAFGLAADARAAGPFELGILDDALLRSTDAGVQSEWLGRASEDGSDVVLSVVAWSAVAPAKLSPGFDPSEPSDPAYDWGTIDSFVRRASDLGLEPILTVTGAPAWAEGRNRPASAAPGTWKPDPGHLREFAIALARRYSGNFTDPAEPLRMLPQVRNYQAWTEPNLPSHLSPQWVGRKAKSPTVYRRLLNGFYAGVKSVSKQNRVIGAGASPYGDDPGGARVRPLRFWRDVFCLRGRVPLEPVSCPDKPTLDVFAHHPINTSGPPQQSAIHPDDVSTPDLGSLQRVLDAAERANTVKPGGQRPLWVTEFWWASDPPASRKVGVAPGKQARYIAESLHLFWKAGAQLAINLRIRDAGKGSPEFGTGLYFKDGSPKPSVRAFRFPFVAERIGGGTIVKIWGKAPSPGRVVLELRTAQGWRRAGTIAAGSSGIFSGRIRVKPKATLRALAGGESSLPFKAG